MRTPDEVVNPNDSPTPDLIAARCRAGCRGCYYESPAIGPRGNLSVCVPLGRRCSPYNRADNCSVIFKKKEPAQMDPLPAAPTTPKGHALDAKEWADSQPADRQPSDGCDCRLCNALRVRNARAGIKQEPVEPIFASPIGHALFTAAQAHLKIQAEDNRLKSLLAERESVIRQQEATISRLHAEASGGTKVRLDAAEKEAARLLGVVKFQDQTNRDLNRAKAELCARADALKVDLRIEREARQVAQTKLGALQGRVVTGCILGAYMDTPANDTRAGEDLAAMKGRAAQQFAHFMLENGLIKVERRDSPVTRMDTIKFEAQIVRPE